jgi:hypothetical protein
VSADDGVHGVEAFLVHDTAAVSETFGTSCGPDMPELRVGPPVVGESLDFSGTAPANALGGLVAGAVPTGPRLQLLGCEVQVEAAGHILLSMFPTGPGGPWTHSTPLPNDGFLVSLQLGAWAAFLPTNGVDPFQGSNGVMLRFGR